MPTARLERWVYNGSYLTRPGRTNRLPTTGFVDTFVLGVTDPVLNPQLMGAGLIRPVDVGLGAIQPTSGTTYTVGNGVVIKDRVIDAYVNTVGTGRVENCIIRGVASGIPLFNGNPDQRALVNTTASTAIEPLDMYATIGQPFDTRGFNISWCTIRPQTPSPYQNGVGNKNVRTYRCLIENVTDGISSFAQASDTNPDGHVRSYDEGSLIRNPVQWRPDVANGNRSHTHNDGEQLQGNLGDRFDILRVGTGYSWTISTEYGTQPPDDPRQHHSCVGTNVNTQTSVYGTWQQAFFWGGIVGFNGGGTTAPGGGHIVLDRCRFERPGQRTNISPLWAAAINSSITRTGSTGNRYHDSPGSGEVPIGSS